MSAGYKNKGLYAIDSVHAENLKFRTRNGRLKWGKKHKDISINDRGNSVQLHVSKGYNSALANTGFVAGESVDVWDIVVSTSGTVRIGVATTDKILSSDEDVANFLILEIAVDKDSTIAVALTKTEIIVTYKFRKFKLGLSPLLGQTVFPLVMSEPDFTFSATIELSHVLDMYISKDNVFTLDTTKEVGYSAPIKFRSGLIVDGGVVVKKALCLGDESNANRQGLCYADTPVFYGNRRIPLLSKLANGAANHIGMDFESMSATDSAWRSIAWSPALGIFVAVASSGADRVMLCEDGLTWKVPEGLAGVLSNAWYSVIWVDDLGIFIATAGGGAGNRIMTSPDGVAWESHAHPVTNIWYSMAYSPILKLVVAVSGSGSGDRVMTSSDGKKWSVGASPADNFWTSIIWATGLGKYVAVASSGNDRAMTSVDGVNWELHHAPACGWQNVAWSPELKLLVAVASTGPSRIMTSPCGTVWTERYSPTSAFQSVAWSPGSGMFVAVAKSGNVRIVSSSDGVVWKPTRSPSTNAWWDIAWSPVLKIFAAVAINGSGDRAMMADTLNLTMNALSLSKSFVPAPTSPGVPGTITRGDDYLYICVAPNTWHRAAYGSW
jgi:hypothetical protein